MKGAVGKAERLFRAAVTAFCALPRPGSHDAAQLDDLTLPLYGQVSPEALRYVAAALSECRLVPQALVRRLADEPVEISASLLMRSGALTDFDLVALIARHGLPHARAIRGRLGLNSAIERLIDALLAAAPAQAAPRHSTPVPPHSSLEEELAMYPGSEAIPPAPQDAAEAVRTRLRGMMAVGGEAASPLESGAPPAGRDVYEKLRETACTGVAALFQTALADAAHISFTLAVALVLPARRRSLMLVLRGLGLQVEQAFVVISAVDPGAHPHPESVRLFLETYSLIHPEAGRDEIRRLRADSVATMIKPSLPAPREQAAGERRMLRAS